MLSLEVKNKIISSLEHLGIDINSELDVIIDQSIESPPNLDLGEKSSNISFKLAKILKKSPIIIAEEIVSFLKTTLSNDDLITEVTVENGYINFFFNFTKIYKHLYSKIHIDKNFGKNTSGKNRKIVIEHTSMNPIKPLHIGNLRNAVLGDIISRIYQWNGWNVEIQNLIDDLGRQVATIVWGFLNNHHLDVPRPIGYKYDLWLGKIYSYCNSIIDKGKLEDQIDKIMIKLKEDTNLYHFMRRLCEKCVLSNLETLWKFDIKYDFLVWESDIAHSKIWEETIELLKQNDHFYWEKEGDNKNCFVANLSSLNEFKDKKNPDKVFIRSNGVPTYVAHDVALQLWKFGKVETKLNHIPLVKQKGYSENTKDVWSSHDFPLDHKKSKDFGNAKRICNVIGSEQNYLQMIVKFTMKLLNLNEEFNNSYHLSYKHVTTPAGRFSGRSGNWFEERAWADAIFEDTYESAFNLLQTKRSDLPNLKRTQIAQKIAIGAIRYWLAKFKTETEIVFKIEDATSLDGDSGPFLMYTYVRANRILEKGSIVNKTDFNLQSITPYAKSLILKIQEFPEVVKNSAKSFSALLITKFALELASLFNKFYETCPVITAESNEKKEFRLSLVHSFTKVMADTLSLLGIPIVEEM